MRAQAAPQHHRIETLSWEARFRHARAASESQDALSRFVQRQALARIQAGFDRHSPPDEVWRLERLEIELGPLALDQDPQAWLHELDRALDRALLQARGAGSSDSSSGQRHGRGAHELELFLFYLQHGHLPWGQGQRSGLQLSAWLVRLARRHGAALWQALQALSPPEPVLARLAQITPHQGLHALLAARHAPLADALQWLDRHWLAPLQAGGRLSAYQMRQLQQRWRVAGLRALWGQPAGQLGSAGLQALLAELLQAHAELLGPQWQRLTRDASVKALAWQLPDSELAGAFWLALQGSEPRSSATWQAALSQLRLSLGQEQINPAQAQRAQALLHQLAASHPAALRQQLQQWMQLRQTRRLWSQHLPPQGVWQLLQLLAPQARPEPPAAPAWADSLRQTALRMLGHCPAAQRPGLSALQSLLMEASLQCLARGERLPDSHAGWQALWQRAWQAWLGAPERQPRAPAPPPATPAIPPEQTLQQLSERCAARQWGMQERLQLARLLETPALCRRWLAQLDEGRRWQMLKAQFGAALQGLRQRAQRLWQRHLARSPVGELARAAQAHWQCLCQQLFVQGLGPQAALLRRHYPALLQAALAELGQPAPPAPATPALPQSAPIWVADGGQVLLAAYAERLFKHLQLCQDGRFVQPQAQARAVQCLQALVHGRQATEEPDWVLSKLLCGLAPAELLPACAPLQEAEHALLDELLGAVIAHWKALGNTSVQGLRESFLRRPARLVPPAPRAENRSWRLQVEPRAFDMLLDRLPWGYSTIKLPWMKELLHVDWR